MDLTSSATGFAGLECTQLWFVFCCVSSTPRHTCVHVASANLSSTAPDGASTQYVNGTWSIASVLLAHRLFGLLFPLQTLLHLQDNYPTMSTIASDLSPFYLSKARDNVKYWKSMRAPSLDLGGTDKTGNCHEHVTLVMWHVDEYTYQSLLCSPLLGGRHAWPCPQSTVDLQVQ